MQNKTKAIFITFNGISDPLGQSQVLPYLQGLSKSGIKFYLVSFEKNIKDSAKFFKILSEAGINWYRLKYFKFLKLGMALNISQCFFCVSYLLILKKARIIHSRSYLPIFSIFFIKKIFKAKIIFDMRGFWPEELIDGKRIKKSSFFYKILKYLEKKSILASDYIITLTPEAKKIIEDNYSQKKVVWMPTCVDPDKFRNKSAVSLEKRFTMVYAGSLWSFYDLGSCADFFNILKTKISGAHFLVLGNNNEQKLDKLFLEKGLKKEEYTIMNLRPLDVPGYLLSADLGISFRYDFYSQKAAFPTKLAEYLIAGLPVLINTPSDFIKEFIESNKIGVVVNNFDKESFEKAADKLLVLLSDKNLKQRCEIASQKYLSKNVCVEKYTEVYQELTK